MIVRSDVPTGVQLAIIHAARHAAQLAGARTAAPPTVAVCLAADPAEPARGAPSGREARLADELADLPHVLVREPDEPWRNALVAIGVVPMPRERVRRPFDHLPMAGGKATP